MTVPGEHLSHLDASNLRVEAHGLPMHVAALALLDGTPLVDGSGGLALEAVRRHVEHRSRRAPRLRQVLRWPPRGRGLPVWADDPGFDITRHLRTARVPQPGDEASLLSLCCRLNQPPLDRSRPLWEMWLLTGLADGRVGLLVRLHHVIADGIAALELVSSMLDLAPGAAAPAPPAPRVGREPPGRASYGGRLGARAGNAWALARLGTAPALSWNRPVGHRQRVLLARADLGPLRTAAHAHGATVNDVVLTAVAGGARRLLGSRGELDPDLQVHVAVPASTRRPGETGGNRVGIRIVPVPVGEPDAVTRLRVVAARTTAQRGRPPYQPNGRLAQRWMVRSMFHQRVVNLVVSNVAGPPVPVCFAGARLHEMFQLSTLQGNLGLGVGVLSYAGRLHVDVTADVDVVPDAEVFAAGLSDALVQLASTLTR